MMEIVIILTGALVLGESTLLLFGYNVPKSRQWKTSRNTLLALSDVIFGGTLILQTLLTPRFMGSLLFHCIALMLLLTHLYRASENRRRKEPRFCVTRYLVVMNDVKIILVVLSILLSLNF